MALATKRPGHGGTPVTRTFPHALTDSRPPQLGLVVLQEDESIEPDFRRLLSPEIELLTTRVPSGTEVTPESLAAMEHHLAAAVSLLPGASRFEALAYACTSGSAQIGPAKVAALLSGAALTKAVTDPVTALVAACRALDVTSIGLLSPYTAQVSDRLRSVLASEGIATPVFGSFEVAEEARVVRIDRASILAAAEALAAEGDTQALFLSCTNLRTLDLIADLEARIGRSVLSSNQVLAWHMSALAGRPPAPGRFGRLFDQPVPASTAPPQGTH